MNKCLKIITYIRKEVKTYQNGLMTQNYGINKMTKNQFKQKTNFQLMLNNFLMYVPIKILINNRKLQLENSNKQ